MKHLMRLKYFKFFVSFRCFWLIICLTIDLTTWWRDLTCWGRVLFSLNFDTDGQALLKEGHAIRAFFICSVVAIFELVWHCIYWENLSRFFSVKSSMIKMLTFVTHWFRGGIPFLNFETCKTNRHTTIK